MNIIRLNTHNTRSRRFRKQLRNAFQKVREIISALSSLLGDHRSDTTSLSQLEAFERSERAARGKRSLSTVHSQSLGQKDQAYLVANGYWDSPSSRNPQ